MMKLKLLIFISVLFSFFVLKKDCYIQRSQDNSRNDTIITKDNIRVLYSKSTKVDSVYIFDKKYNVLERGYIKDNVITFKNNANQTSSIGKFYNKNFQGNFLFFKNKSLYKTVAFKDGKEEGFELTFNRNLQIETISEYKNGKVLGFSMIFHDNVPQYVSTGNFNDSLAVLGSFKDGKVNHLFMPNNEDDYYENALKNILIE